MPKTGGTFIRETIGNLGIENEEIGQTHEHVISFIEKYPDYLKGRIVFTFIRHPLDWWKSYWSYRVLTGWSPDSKIDRECNDNDFQIYIDKILKSQWKYHYINICRGFLTSHTDYVGRQENLVDDLKNILIIAGELHDNNSVGLLEKINTSNSQKEKYSYMQKRKMKNIHKEIISQYYPKKFFGLM